MHQTATPGSDALVSGQVVVDLSRLTEYYRIMSHAAFEGRPELDVLIEKWGARYRAYVLEHFDKSSLGGGDWPPLAASTLLARQRRHSKTGKGINPTILVDTGLLRSSLSVDMSSPYKQFSSRRERRGTSVITIGSFGMAMRVSFGGKARYPNGTSVSDVARFHQFGGRRLPRRPILIQPDDKLIDAMTGDAQVFAESVLKNVNARVH